jgi:hypothetical protein
VDTETEVTNAAGYEARATAARLDGLLRFFQVGSDPPQGPNWHNLREVLGDGRVIGWIDAVEDRVGRRDAATSFLGSWVATPLVSASVTAVLVENRCPRMCVDSAYLRQHPEGWFDGIIFADPEIAILPGDDGVADPFAKVLAGRHALCEYWARGIVAVLGPIFDAVASNGRFGRRGLWGNGLVDRTFATAIDLGISVGNDREPDARALLDAAQAVAPIRLPEPRVQEVSWRGGGVALPVKSCCCLFYKTFEPEQRRPESFCTGCPLIDDNERADRFAAWLDDTNGSHPRNAQD